MNNNIDIEINRIESKSIEGANTIIKFIKNFISNNELPRSFEVNLPYIVLSNNDDYMKIIKKLESILKDETKKIEPSWAIPMLLEVYNKLDYSYDNINSEESEFLLDFGCGVKRAIIYMSEYVINREENYRKNINQLFNVIYISYIITCIYSSYIIFLYDNSFQIKIENNTIKCADSNSYLINFKFSTNIMSGRGMRQRVVNDVKNAIVNKMNTVYFNLLQIIQNKLQPVNVSEFEGTIFKKIPGPQASDEYRKFWENITFRLSMIIQIVAKKFNKHNDNKFFNELIVVDISRFKSALPNDILMYSFLNFTETSTYSTSVYDNLILLKPFIMISEKKAVTSIPLLIDSFAAFVEEAIIPSYSKIKSILHLPSDSFRNIISEPFEEKCIDLFRKKGFIAGHVNDNNVWITKEKHIKLPSDLKIPGEVDVLAYHKELNKIFLIECKALRDIHDPFAFKNSVAKIVYDDEGYRKKLNKKAEWLITALKKIEIDAEMYKIIVCDIKLPFFNERPIDEIYYVSFDILTSVLEKLLNEEL